MANQKPNILALIGVPDNKRAVVDALRLGAVHYTHLGNTELLRGLDNTGARIRRLHLYNQDISELGLRNPHLIINCIADADASSIALTTALSVVEHVNVPVINHPARILGTTREQTARLLPRSAKRYVPRTDRITPHRLADLKEYLVEQPFPLPCILRTVGTHMGENMLLIESPDDLDKAERFAFDGQDFYLIEFLDFRSADNLYRKYRLVFVDGVPYPRHLLLGQHWNVHAATRFELMQDNAALREEEMQFLTDHQSCLHPEAWAFLQAIPAAIGLDYFVLDFSILPDQKILVFECNAAVNAFGNPSMSGGVFSYLKPPTDRIISATVTMACSR